MVTATTKAPLPINPPPEETEKTKPVEVPIPPEIPTETETNQKPEIPPEAIQEIVTELSILSGQIKSIRDVEKLTMIETKFTLLRQALDGKIASVYEKIFGEINRIMSEDLTGDATPADTAQSEKPAKT